MQANYICKEYRDEDDFIILKCFDKIVDLLIEHYADTGSVSYRDIQNTLTNLEIYSHVLVDDFVFIEEEDYTIALDHLRNQVRNKTNKTLKLKNRG